MTLAGLPSAIVRHIQGSSQEQIEWKRACLDNADWQNKTAQNRIWCQKSLKIERQTVFMFATRSIVALLGALYVTTTDPWGSQFVKFYSPESLY